MTSDVNDLVERLAILAVAYVHVPALCKSLKEAATEIERLEKELEIANEVYDLEHDTTGKVFR